MEKGLIILAMTRFTIDILKKKEDGDYKEEEEEEDGEKNILFSIVAPFLPDCGRCPIDSDTVEILLPGRTKEKWFK